MFTSSPFAEIAVYVPPLAMQVYVILMALAVAGGTLFDVIHKSSWKYFAEDWKKKSAAATRRVGGFETAYLAAKTLGKEIITSGEFCNQRRRISHLLMFYGFLTYVITTIIMVFGYPTNATPAPAIVPLLWNLGAVMVLIGGYWFFFFLRVNVAHEGHSPFTLIRADIFIVTLLGSVTFALLWELAQGFDSTSWTMVFFAIYVFFSTALFVTVPWSKFAHMFYKPAAALQKKVEDANGSSTLPMPAGERKVEV
jgi:hypothetical protein